MAAYYVVCESLANIGKHAARSSARVDVTRTNGQVVIEVADDGVGGADTEARLGPARARGPRRVARRPARIWSPRGGGTRVKAEIPCGSRSPRTACCSARAWRVSWGAGLDVVAQCDNADDLLVEGSKRSVDVAIVDIRLPPTHNDEGLRAALEIRADHPAVGVLVLSQYVELGLAMKLLANSAEGVGYLLKDRIGDLDEFVGAVERVAGGRLGPRSDHRLDLALEAANEDPLGELTPREREVLTLMAEGRSNQGIADKLVITLRAVEKYVSTIFGKLGLPSTGSDSRRVLAVLLYLRS